jgi:hypothetical protein
MDLDGLSGRNDGYGRILRAWTCAHVDVRRRKALCRLRHRGREHQQTGCGDFH